MTAPLFRKEVLQAGQSRWLGGICLSQPLPLWLMTGAAVLAAVAIGLFLALGQYTRRTRVVGQLVPALGLSTVAAPTTGTLERVTVEEGQHVRAGTVLAVLTVPNSTMTGDTAQALQAAIEQRRRGVSQGYDSQRRQLQAQQAGLDSQIAIAEGELRQVERQLATRRQQQALAESLLERYNTLRAQQYVTDLQVQQQKAAALDQVSQVQALEQQLQASRRVLAQLRQQDLELPAQASALDAALHRDTASLAQESVEARARAEAVIKSPVTGTVATVLGQAGESLRAGQSLLSVLPESSVLQAQLLVPSRAVGFIEPGDTVLLRYQAYPYQKFGHYRGRVARVSRSALSEGDLGTLIGNAQAGEPYYRVIVKLDSQHVRAYGKNEPLKPGLLLEADILGEQRKLWEWAIEPLYSLTGSIGNR